MSLQSRKEYIKQVKDRYNRAKNQNKKTELVDEIVQVTGYHRKYAIHLVNTPTKEKCTRVKRVRQLKYTEAMPYIQKIWKSLDYPCAERLHPILVETAELLAKHGHFIVTPLVRVQLTEISRTTLGRRLSGWLSQKPKGTMTRSAKSFSRLRSEIPVQRYDWNEMRPGALEIDLVEHNGGSSSGHYAYTLSVVDIVTGYSRRRALLGRSQKAVFAVLHPIIDQWPHRPWGLHADNGSEFMSAHVTVFCKEKGIQFTRSRPYKKNDNAHVEQKNLQYVREVVGYERYDTSHAVEWLNAVYACLDEYANLFLPMRKIISKERQGGKIKKRCDQARSPFQRLVETNVLSQEMHMQLQAQKHHLDPMALHEQLEKLIQGGVASFAEIHVAT